MTRWRFDFAAALAAALIILFLGALLGQAMYLTDWPDKGLEYWMERYQTVFVSLVAVVGLVGVSNQIKATQRQTRAALETAHKPEFDALTLTQNLFSILSQHITFSLNFTARHGGAGGTTSPPETPIEDINSIRTALKNPGRDPFGLSFAHEHWQQTVEEYRSGSLDQEALAAMGEYIIGACQEGIEQAQSMAEALHAQIDASV